MRKRIATYRLCRDAGWSLANALRETFGREPKMGPTIDLTPLGQGEDLDWR